MALSRDDLILQMLLHPALYTSNHSKMGIGNFVNLQPNFQQSIVEALEETGSYI